MHRQRHYPQGRVIRECIDSDALKGNLLGEPYRRAVDVYIPAGHDGSGLPLLVDLVGFTAGGLAHTSWKNFGENVPERLDRLLAENRMPPVVCVFPDCFTRLGGNQYINSIAMGHWADFLCQEMVPQIERQFACGGDAYRGVFGKSSGGYGALVHALLYGDFWAAAACHSGDMGFDLMFATEFPAVLRSLAKHQYSIEAFINQFHASPKVNDKDIHVLMMLAMAASYDPDPNAFLGIRLPVTMDTCEYIPEFWQNWLKWDPLNLLAEHAGQLKKLKGLYLDCGDNDQYNLVYGARRMHRELDKLGISHRYEEFPDNHSGIDYRMDISLPWLAELLSE